jgi:hypothetical protein
MEPPEQFSNVQPQPPPLSRRRRSVSLRTLILVSIGALLLGGAIGFLLGMGGHSSRDIDDLVTSLTSDDEEGAAVGKPKTIDRKDFSLQYPSNWRIETEADDYDPDTNFVIIGPASDRVVFLMVEGDPNVAVADQVAAHSKGKTDVSVTPFARYGRYEGVGAIIKGKVHGITLVVKVFAFSKGGQSVTIVQISGEVSGGPARRGLELIEKSFDFKPEPDQADSHDGPE